MLYEITLNENKLNDYQIGRISGIVYVLSGMPEKHYGFRRHQDGGYCSIFFEGNPDILYNVQKTINKLYPCAIIEDVD